MGPLNILRAGLGEKCAPQRKMLGKIRLSGSVKTGCFQRLGYHFHCPGFLEDKQEVGKKQMSMCMEASPLAKAVERVAVLQNSELLLKKP